MLVLKKGYIEDLKVLYPIYCDAFPESERKSYDKLSELILNESYQLIVAYDTQMVQNQPVGFACILIDHYIWLDYLLIDPSFQGFGYGGKIFNALIERYQNEKQGMFLEVEQINLNDLNTQRRVDFYHRLGAFETTIAYQLPTQKGGFPMSLFYFPLLNALPTMVDCLRAIQFAFDVIHNDLDSSQEIYKWILAKNKERICQCKVAPTDS